MSIIGTRNGLIRRGPFSIKTLNCSERVMMPPTPLAMSDDVRSPSGSSPSRPACAMASRVAAIASWEKRSARRASLRFM